MEHTARSSITSEQRSDCRVDDWLPVALWLETGEAGSEREEDPPPAPTIESVRRTLNALRTEWTAHPEAAGSATAALAKLEWLMEMVLLAVARLDPAAVRLPVCRAVNLSGSGLRCEISRSCRVGDKMGVELILPPFLRIRAVGVVVDCHPLEPPRAGAQVGIKFVEIAEDDRERIIQHVFRRQAERLRARRMQETGS